MAEYSPTLYKKVKFGVALIRILESKRNNINRSG